MYKTKETMRKIYILLLGAASLAACHESMEKRAQREAKEYTAKYCPTPAVNYTRTDSVVFYPETKTYHYYCSFVDKMDDADIINKNRQLIDDMLLKLIIESTELKPFKEAGFTFAYTCHSDKNPQKVLFETKYTRKRY